jgi:hypothetical protein
LSCASHSASSGPSAVSWARALNRLVGPGEILEVRHDARGPFRGVEGLQHMIADEISEVADRFHGNGPMKQFHRLLGLDAETAAEILAVFREAVVDPGARGAQPPAQRAHVRTEVGEITGHRQGLVRDHVEPVRLPAGVGGA